MDHQLGREEIHNTEGHGTAGGEHSEEVEEPRPNNRWDGRKRVGVDDRRHRVGGVMESVDELKGQRKKERKAEQDQCTGRDCGDVG